MKKKKHKQHSFRLFITEFGNPILRQKTHRVTSRFLKSTVGRDLIAEMRKMMHRAQGVGIAANQVGRKESIALIEVPKNDRRLKKGFPFTVVANPKITRQGKVVKEKWEGCLSLPTVRGKVFRSESIIVSYMNGEGRKLVQEINGFAAQIFQHEVDHLNGIVYVDRMKSMKTLMSLAEFDKRVRRKRR